MKENKIDFDTVCVHGTEKRYNNTGAISVPIYQTATFSHLGVGKSTGFDYSRLQNPTREHVEKTVANLEGGLDAIAFSSGMAAITNLMELFSPSDHVISSDDIYGGTHRLFHHISMKNNLNFSFGSTTEEIKNLITSNTKAIFVETPTNPMMQVTDIKSLSVFAKENNLILIVDNTFLTPYFQKPIDLGADIVVHSGTKFLGGHNDTIAGFLVFAKETHLDKVRFIAKTIGAGLAPFDSWLILRGIKTLSIRMDRQQESALQIAKWLKEQEGISKVYYIGLEDHPDYPITKKQTTGFGSMISFEVKSNELAIKILESLQIIQFAESLGGVETLITFPAMQTHADVPKEERDKKGVNDKLLRLSVGIENVTDLINDLKNAITED